MNTQTQEALKMAIDDARIGLGKVRQYLGWQEPKEDELCLEILKAWKTLDACKEALNSQDRIVWLASHSYIKKNIVHHKTIGYFPTKDAACEYIEIFKKTNGLLEDNFTVHRFDAKFEPSQEQEPVAWMKSALDNARDVCKYLDHDMIKKAKAHTKFFWNDVKKIKEPDTHPAQPLSNDEIHNLAEYNGIDSLYESGRLDFARAIEKAIMEKNK